LHNEKFPAPFVIGLIFDIKQIRKEFYMVELDQIKYGLPAAKANLTEVGDSL